MKRINEKVKSSYDLVCLIFFSDFLYILSTVRCNFGGTFCRDSYVFRSSFCITFILAFSCLLLLCILFYPLLRAFFACSHAFLCSSVAFSVVLIALVLVASSMEIFLCSFPNAFQHWLFEFFVANFLIHFKRQS